MRLPFKPWLDQAGRFSITHIPGIPHYNSAVSSASPRTGVLHTTEGGWTGSLNIFKQHYAPHFMLGYDAVAKEVRIAQLVQVGTIGASLKAHNNKALVQIEMIGFSKEAPWLPDVETTEALASLMAVCNLEYQIPFSRPWKDGDFGRAGNNPHRSSGKFGIEPGWYGHGDCPSPDNHWDPGNLKWTDIFARARKIAEPMSPSSFEAGPIAMTGAKAGFPLQEIA